MNVTLFNSAQKNPGGIPLSSSL